MKFLDLIQKHGKNWGLIDDLTDNKWCAETIYKHCHKGTKFRQLAMERQFPSSYFVDKHESAQEKRWREEKFSASS